jgi:hypothetical protein
VAFSYIARASFRFGRPCCSDLLVWFLEAREQFFSDPRPIAPRQPECFDEQFVSRHREPL